MSPALFLVLGLVATALASATLPPYPQPGCPYQPIPVPLPASPGPGFTQALAYVKSISSSFLADGALNASCSHVVISYRGQTIFSLGTGTLNFSTTAQPTGDTPFRIGSVSKLFAMLLTLAAYEDGLLKSLDDPVQNYYKAFKPRPPLANPTQPVDPITFRQLMTQMSGLQREVPCGSSGSSVLECNLTTAQVVALVSQTNLLWPPNTRPSYSNLGFALLGNIVAEALYKTDFEAAVNKRILSPLGLKNTGVTITPEVAARMPVGYAPNGQPTPLIDLGWVSPAGQMYSSTNDLTALMNLFVKSVSEVDSNGLSASLLREALLPVWQNPDLVTGFGLPWENLWSNNYLARTKGGDIPGFSAVVSVLPELQLSVNAVWNGAANQGAYLYYVLNNFIPALVAELTQDQPDLPQPPNPSLYTGAYSVDGELALTVSVMGGSLVITSADVGLVYLSYLGNNTFTALTLQSSMTCMDTELIALYGQYVFFNTTSNPVGLTIPGVVPGVVLLRAPSIRSASAPLGSLRKLLRPRY